MTSQGGVPEQGLRDALDEIVRLTRGVSGSMITSQVNRIARAALARPRPALPLTATGVVTMSRPCASCGGCDYICADCGNTGAALPPQAGNPAPEPGLGAKLDELLEDLEQIQADYETANTSEAMDLDAARIACRAAIHALFGLRGNL